MEIISYNSNNFATVSNTNSRTFYPKVGIKKSQAAVVVHDVEDFKNKDRNFSWGDFFADLKGYIGIAYHFLLASFKYFWLIPAVVLVAFVPRIVSKILDSKEYLAGIVEFAPDNEAQQAYLDSLLSDFAMDNFVEMNDFGELIGEDGLPIAVPTVSFSEPVTFSKYTVKSGDTISGITQKFGLSNISTLIAVNGIENVRNIVTGQKLTVPSIDGLYHKVAAGESLAKIASNYSVSVEDLLDVNDLSTSVVAEGANLFIPGAKMDKNAIQKAMGDVVRWKCPIYESYTLSSYFGKRKDPISGVQSNHKGIDMACPTGTKIHASLKGTVVYSGWSNTFGYHVIINHANGYQTLYGHMSKILVQKNATVKQGDVIGLVGSTGYSTGPHLHFQVFKNSKLVDPLSLINKKVE